MHLNLQVPKQDQSLKEQENQIFGAQSQKFRVLDKARQFTNFSEQYVLIQIRQLRHTIPKQTYGYCMQLVLVLFRISDRPGPVNRTTRAGFDRTKSNQNKTRILSAIYLSKGFSQ